MSTAPPISSVANGAPASAGARAECAEAALAQAQARIAALEGQLTAAADTAQRHYAQLVALVQAQRVGLVLVDPAGQIRFVNQPFWELFGLAPVPNPGPGAPPLAPADVYISGAFADPAAFVARVRALNAAGRTALREKFVLADGRVVELDYLVLDEGRGGRLICYRDVTERHRRAAQLAEQRTFYETVLEQVPTAVAMFDAAHRYLYANPALEPDPAVRAWMLGKTSSEAGLRRQRPPAVVAQRAAVFAEVVRTQRAATWDEVLPGADGPRHFQVSYRPVPGPAGAQWVISAGIDITERQQAEERLAEQQKFYESVLNMLPVGVAVFDPDQRYLFVNPSGLPDPAERERSIGLTIREVMATRLHLPHGLAEQRARYFAQAVATRRDVSWEELHPTPQGPQLMLRALRPVFAADGTLRWVVGTGLDLTARHAAEQSQRQAQQRLQEQRDFSRRVVDALPDAVYMMGPDGRPVFANAAFHASILHSAHVQPTADRDAVVLDELQQIADLNALVLRTQQPQVRELTFTLTTGETRYLHVLKQLMAGPDGQPSIFTVSTDVTAVKQARLALEQREKQYHDLVHYSQALICTHDPAGRLLSVNPAIEQLMGLPAAALVGHYLHGAMLPEHRAELEAYLAGTQPELTEPRLVTVQTATGERRYLHYYTHRVAEPGQPPYVVASGYDVTPGVRAQRALEQAKREAEESARAKEAFLAHMSHEIRTPLNGVLGMAALLQKTPLTEAQAEYLHTMQHAGRHLLALINDVLDMAKITAQQLTLDHAPFDLAVALQGAGQTVAALAEAKGLRLTVAPWPEGLAPRVLGDAYRLHQVLLNLLGNAIKFTERGRVRLGTDVLRDSPGALTVRFWVEDTGIGIAPAQQAHIFEAFAQAGAETSPRFGGTGLGLAISQQLVAQMGGVLRLTSTPGQGTTFAFQLTLPRPAPVAAPAPPPAAPAYDGLRGQRILLAEDNPVNQFIAVVVLERWGVQVQAVANGTDALDYLRTQPFDAALLDIRMPGLNGVAVTAAIRQHPDPVRATVPIIALTANAFDTDRAGYLAAGMDACLTKPYEEAALYQLLMQLLARAPGPED